MWRMQRTNSSAKKLSVSVLCMKRRPSVLQSLLEHLLCCLLLCQRFALHEMLPQISISLNDFVGVSCTKGCFQVLLEDIKLPVTVTLITAPWLR